jgi:hypothetical protein
MILGYCGEDTQKNLEYSTNRVGEVTAAFSRIYCDRDLETKK